MELDPESGTIKIVNWGATYRKKRRCNSRSVRLELAHFGQRITQGRPVQEKKWIASRLTLINKVLASRLPNRYNHACTDKEPGYIYMHHMVGLCMCWALKGHRTRGDINLFVFRISHSLSHTVDNPQITSWRWDACEWLTGQSQDFGCNGNLPVYCSHFLGSSKGGA